MFVSFRFALFMIATIALWQRVGISWSSGGAESCSIFVACVWVCAVCVVSSVGGVSGFGLGSMFLAVFLSLVIRRSCLVSDFVMGGVILWLYLFVVAGLLAILFWLGCGRYLRSPPPF